MAKSKLEEILLSASANSAAVTKLVENNHKDVLKSTMKEEINSFLKGVINEAADAEDESTEDEYSETDTETEMDSEAPSEDDDMDTETDDTETEMDDEFDETDDSEESPIDMDATDDDTEDEFGDMEGGGDEQVDMENASPEEVIQFLSTLPKGQDVTITSKDSYQIKTANPQAGMGGGMSSKMGGGMSSEMGALPMGENKKMPFKKNKPVPKKEKLDEAGCKDESIMGEEETLFEVEMDNLKENRKQPFKKQPVRENKTNLQKLENCVKELINLNDSMLAENKKLKAENIKAGKFIQESTNNLKKLALTNSNLAYVSRIFTENSTTKEEKLAILKKFDNTKSIAESQKVFATIIEGLQKSHGKKANPMKEVFKGKEVTSKGKEVVRESVKKEIDPEQQRIVDLFNYKN